MPIGTIAARQATAKAPTTVGAISSTAGLITGFGGAITSLIGFAAAFNKPYGTCAPNSRSAPEFLRCWRHDKPAKFIPYFKGEPTAKQPGTKGWDFAVCRGALAGSVAPPGGCQPGCNCINKGCVCAPVGAVEGLLDGTFIDANGRNLGPAVDSDGGTGGNYMGDGAPFPGYRLGEIGTSIGNGIVATNRSIAANGLQQQAIIPGLTSLGTPTGKLLAYGLVAIIVLAGVMVFAADRR